MMHAYPAWSREFVEREQEIGEHVAARLERQRILNRAKPPMLWAVVDEGVLRRPDSRDPDGAKLIFATEQWLTFTGGVKAGDFDLA